MPKIQFKYGSEEFESTELNRDHIASLIRGFRKLSKKQDNIRVVSSYKEHIYLVTKNDDMLCIFKPQ